MLEMSSRFVFLYLVTFCGQTHSFVPDMNKYTPQVVKPLFDLMREYGLELKVVKSNEMCTKDQFLVVLMASPEEMLQLPLDINSGNRIEAFKKHFNERLLWLPNKKKHNIPEWNCNRALHGEINFIQNHFKAMLDVFNKKYPKKTPVVLMYSHFIPCADVPDLGYSCSEELGVFATREWNKIGLLLAFSRIFQGTDANNAVRFLQLAGIPGFRYEESNDGERFVQAYQVKSADNKDRWRSVAFFQNFFSCLEAKITHGCLPAKDEPVFAFFVNYVAYDCFRNMDFKWRKKNRSNITECFIDRIEKNIGSKCKICKGLCASSKKEIAQKCVVDSFDESLVPGGPIEPFDPFRYSWTVTEDVPLNKIFSPSAQNSLQENPQKPGCKDRSLTMKSLCTA